MYTSRLTRRHAYLFRNNEVFITTATIHETNREIEWFIPEKLEALFYEYISENPVEDPYSEKTIERIRKYFSETLGIDMANVSISVSLEFQQGEGRISAANPGILYNQTDLLPDVHRSLYSDIYKDKKQKVAVKIEGDCIVSIAFDNGNGAVTIETVPMHVNTGEFEPSLRGKEPLSGIWTSL